MKLNIIVGSKFKGVRRKFFRVTLNSKRGNSKQKNLKLDITVYNLMKNLVQVICDEKKVNHLRFI